MTESRKEEGKYDLLVAPCRHSIEDEVLNDNIYVCTYAKKNKRPQKSPPDQTEYFAPYKDKKIQFVYKIDCLVNVKIGENRKLSMCFQRLSDDISQKKARERVKKFLLKSKNCRIRDFYIEEYLLGEYGMNLLLLSSEERTECDSEVIRRWRYYRDIAKDLKSNKSKKLADKMDGKVLRKGKLRVK